MREKEDADGEGGGCWAGLVSSLGFGETEKLGNELQMIDRVWQGEDGLDSKWSMEFSR